MVMTTGSWLVGRFRGVLVETIQFLHTMDNGFDISRKKHMPQRLGSASLAHERLNVLLYLQGLNTVVFQEFICPVQETRLKTY